MEKKISVLVIAAVIIGLTAMFIVFDSAEFDLDGVLNDITNRNTFRTSETSWTYLNDVLDRDNGLPFRVEVALENLNECKYSCYHSHFMDVYCWFDAVNEVKGCSKGGPDGVIVYWEDT